MLAWARVEQHRPEQVKLFFFEDFVREPETAFRGLARFLGIDHSDILPQIMCQSYILGGLSGAEDSSAADDVQRLLQYLHRA